ncbi:mechanosensitive ion channel family protein [Glaciecola sp. KUL10]|uniref:mechanosensitive ion channel family protein n=1 Tax=Glaciecola sp. (strain KUL10) TaxID=2161813 RepID=UPI000D7835C9|nr:mechanosensitive ion channel domain-containing protein [Glaciecola sp. KUL10]GBL03921.1 mechanosensitive ion channel family protein [Glaciecola sp. KUL10]
MLTVEQLQSLFADWFANSIEAIVSPDFYIQIGIIASIYLSAFLVAKRINASIGITPQSLSPSIHPLKCLLYRVGSILFPFLAIVFLRLSVGISNGFEYSAYLLNIAMVLALLMFFNSLIKVFVTNHIVATYFRWVGLPILFLHLTGKLVVVISALESISINVGNIEVSAYGFARVLVFGSLLFWLGRASNTFGKDIIRKQVSLDIRTREVFTKLFEVGLFCIISLLILNVMGINLTALAVFGGAVGVGLGLGLQTIASNFISGIIILLDRSLTVGDYVELDDGPKGFVREFRMRYTVLETYDGKDIVVPNERFISNLFVNWTHKDPKQRYRVDFAVPYSTDVRAIVEVIKAAVAEHPQVLSGDELPIEDRPDCEIDSFGDSGINLFVEFWMMGIDDGKNRVGGDLLLIIFETLREQGIEMPFPQREVRIL